VIRRFPKLQGKGAKIEMVSHRVTEITEKAKKIED